MATPVASEAQSAEPSVLGLLDFTGAPTPWNSTTYIALLALVILWAARMYLTWATWGDLTIDCGREVYTATILSEGKTLYRDAWYPYTPAGPYLNSYLFRLFGPHLRVAYWAGSLSALGCALLLYVSGMKLSSWIAGWTAGAIVVIQAFQPGIFNFPFPYTFAAVYGCLTACFFLWAAIHASASDGWAWVFAAGTASAAAFLVKPEFGMACYLTLVLLMIARGFQRRSWRFLIRDFLAILPGIVVCGVVLHWMISIAGFKFITQENIVSWPTSFFMRNFGKKWMDASGLGINGVTIAVTALRTGLAGLVGMGFLGVLRRAKSNARLILLVAALSVVALASLVSMAPWPFEILFRWIFFPPDMVLYVSIAALAAWWCFLKQPFSRRNLATATLLSFSGLLAFRVLLGMSPSGYPIYYNGPAVLSSLLLASAAVAWGGRSRQSIFYGQLFVCFVCLTAVVLHMSVLPKRHDLVPLATARGTIRVSKSRAQNYEAAIEFIKEKTSLGEPVLSIPEDPTLYFFSGVNCPTRVMSFTPGVVAPGRMTEEVINEIEKAHVRYLLWSNRAFPEFGVPLFGTDFDRTLGDYLRAHYRFVRPLVPGSPIWDWHAGVYERKPET